MRHLRNRAFRKFRPEDKSKRFVQIISRRKISRRKETCTSFFLKYTFHKFYALACAPTLIICISPISRQLFKYLWRFLGQLTFPNRIIRLRVSTLQTLYILGETHRSQNRRRNHPCRPAQYRWSWNPCRCRCWRRASRTVPPCSCRRCPGGRSWSCWRPPRSVCCSSCGRGGSLQPERFRGLTKRRRNLVEDIDYLRFSIKCN